MISALWFGPDPSKRLAPPKRPGCTKSVVRCHRDGIAVRPFVFFRRCAAHAGMDDLVGALAPCAQWNMAAVAHRCHDGMPNFCEAASPVAGPLGEKPAGGA